jgi:hypothetical protein
MINQDIIEGLKLAMSRGETLEQAMNSFYNAGYKKQDIENSARQLNFSEYTSNEDSKKDITPPEMFRGPRPSNLPISKHKQIPQTFSINNIKQSVSGYNENPKSFNKKKKQKRISDYSYKKPILGKIILIILLVLFIILVVSLGAVVFFKPQIQEFFSSF